MPCVSKEATRPPAHRQPSSSWESGVCKLLSQENQGSWFRISGGFRKMRVPSWGPYCKGILVYLGGVYLGVPLCS